MTQHDTIYFHTNIIEYIQTIFGLISLELPTLNGIVISANEWY